MICIVDVPACSVGQANVLRTKPGFYVLLAPSLTHMPVHKGKIELLKY